MFSCFQRQFRLIISCKKVFHRSANISTNTNMSKVIVNTVTGWEDRQNDVLTLADRDVNELSKTVLYFGGDVQNLEQEMMKHRDNKRYSDWSLERTALLLAQAYTDSYIVVVRPSRMERATFSCFDNFVPSNSVGSPEHSEDAGAIIHLQHLLGALRVSTVDI